MISERKPKVEIKSQSTAIQPLEVEYRYVLRQMEGRAPKLKELVIAEPSSLAQLQKAMNEEHFEVLST